MKQSRGLELALQRAQQWSIGCGHSTLGVEHLFHYLLEMKKDVGAELSDPSVAQDIEKLQERISQESFDASAVARNMEREFSTTDPTEGKNAEEELQSVLNKAEMVSNILGEQEVHPYVVLSVILDAPPLMVKNAINAAHSSPSQAQTVMQETDPEATVFQAPPQPEPITKPEYNAPPQPTPPPFVPPAAKKEPPVTPASPIRGGQQDGSYEEPPFKVPNAQQEYEHLGQVFSADIKKPSFGKAVASSIVYFVLALLIPYLLRMLIDNATGAFTNPSSVAAATWANLYGILWFSILLGGVATIAGRISKMGGVFAKFLIALFVIVMFGKILVQTIPLIPVPVWLEILLFIACLIAIGSAGNKIKYLQVKDQVGELFTTHSPFIKMSGTAQGIFFSFAIKSFTLPVIISFLVFVFTKEFPQGWKLFFLIYNYWWAFVVLDMALQCNLFRYEHASYNQMKKKKGAVIGLLQARLLCVPVFGLYLIWYFGWWPMKTWVMVLYIIYFIGWLLLTIFNARRDASEF